MTRFLLTALACGVLVGLATAGPGPEIVREGGQDVVFLAPNRPLVVRVFVEVDGQAVSTLFDGWVRDLFAFLDRDGDGKLNPEEAERAPKAQALVQRLQQGAIGTYSETYQTTPLGEVDDNGDGKVTLEELTIYYRTSELMVPRMGSLSGVGYPSDALTNALFDQFDVNKDGRLTSQEMTRAAAVVTKLDANDDETVSAAELLPGVPQGQIGQPLGGMGGMGRNTGGGGVFFLATGRLDLAQQVLGRYDRNKDERVTRDEIELDDATYQRLDTNGDLDLDARELLKLIGKSADVEVIVRLGKIEAKQTTVEMIVATEGHAFVKSKLVNGGLTLTFGPTALDVRPTPVPTYLAQMVDNVKRQAAQTFKRLDTAQRGFVEKADLDKRQSRNLSPIFDLADHDADGKLTEKELTAFMELDGRSAAFCVSLSAGESGRGLFEVIDANRDGRLTAREMRTACDRLAGADTDGAISKSRLPRQFGLNVTQGAVAAYGNRLPQVQAVPGGAVGAPAWFRKMDSNGDGDVSRREWLGEPSDFQQLDTDGDGAISPEEAAAQK